MRFAVHLWLDAVVALVVLAFVGGWALWPFRRPDRPYLLLAAPLAGIGLLSAALTGCYCVCGMSVPLSGVLAILLLGTCTLVCLVKRVRQHGAAADWPWILGLLIVVSAGSTAACNWTALLRHQPTVCLQDGTDTLGYTGVGDWILKHPHVSPTLDPDRPSEAYPYAIHGVAGRPGTHLLAALAGWVRGTTCLFAYDWAVGIGLCVGILGFAGIFASSRRGLILLVAAGALSLWLQLSRTGYLGKLLAYPGCIFLCALFLETWRRPTAARLALAALFGVGFSLCHNGMTGAAVLALVASGSAVALVLVRFVLKWEVAPLPDARACLKFLARAAAVCVLMAGPGLAIQYLTFMYPVPVWPLDWPWLTTVALDLDCSALPLLSVSLHGWLLAAAVITTGGLLVVALGTGEWQAAGLLLSVALVPAAWWLDRKELVQFTGLLFPLSAAGAVLVIQRLQSARWSLRWAVLGLGVMLIAVRAPQLTENVKRYVLVPPDSVHCYAQSDIEDIARLTAGRTTDVGVSDLYSGLVLLTELGARDIKVQYREPTWSSVVGFTGWKAPAFSHRGDLTLSDRTRCVPRSSVRFQSPQFSLAEDRDSVSLLSIQSNYFCAYEGEARPWFWLGHDPAKFTVLNSTQSAQEVCFTATSKPGVGLPETAARVIHCRLDNQCSAQVLDPEHGWQVRLPLTVPPGVHQFSVWVEEARGLEVSSEFERTGYLLVFTDYRIEPRSFFSASDRGD